MKNHLTFPICYDTKFGKTGVVIPFNKEDYLNKEGVCRFFHIENTGNDYQRKDKHFVDCGSIPVSDIFVIESIKIFLRDNKRNSELYDFYKDFFIMDKSLGIVVFNENWELEI